MARRRGRHEDQQLRADHKTGADAAAQTDGRAQQVLFLFGDDHRVTVGSMNVCRHAAFLSNWTAPLSGDILPGVTRRSLPDGAADPG